MAFVPGSRKKHQGTLSLGLSRYQLFSPPFGMLDIESGFLGFSDPYEIAQVHDHNTRQISSLCRQSAAVLDAGVSEERLNTLLSSPRPSMPRRRKPLASTTIPGDLTAFSDLPTKVKIPKTSLLIHLEPTFPSRATSPRCPVAQWKESQPFSGFLCYKKLPGPIRNEGKEQPRRDKPMK